MDILQNRRGAADDRLAALENVLHYADHHDILMNFESLGGNGHGPEFALVQKRRGVEPGGLLAWADLGVDLLVGALETRFDGVGLGENTIVFTPDHSEEWWTKDKRYWMAMRSFINADRATFEQATFQACERLLTLRAQLIMDLEAGEKIFTFKNLERTLTDTELNRLHRAIRAYSNSTVFYVGYADADHPAGHVEVAAPGLLIGYVDHFSFSCDNKPLGSSDKAWLALCERAAELHDRRPVRRSANVRPPPDNPKPKAWIEQQPDVTTDKLTYSTAGQLDAPLVFPMAGAPRRGRQIVLIGNCQMQAMAGLHKRFIAGRSGDVVAHVPSYNDLSEDNRKAIQQADLVVEQLFDLKPQVDTDTVTTSAPRIFIPMVTAAFLWPFAGSPHPKNTLHPFLTGGPYGGEAADSYLNRLILSGIDPEEAVETYAGLDVNSRVNLNRLYELVMDRQRSRDEAAGYQIADIMERHFRTEQIFLSPYHPNVRVATALASQFFEQLGADRSDIERMQSFTRVTPFPKSELPFHPSVCRHFGLDFIAPARRYRFMNEGLFTFREYALRYMRYEWNDAIEDGIHLSQIGKMSQARERLTVAVQRSPFSAAAYNALGHVLNHQGARDEAVTALRQAVAIEPEAAPYHANLGSLLRQACQFEEALTELEAAVAIDPMEPHFRVLLAHLLRQQGDVEAACDVICEAIRLDPFSPGLRAELSGSLEAKNDLAGAVLALGDAVAMNQTDEALRIRLAQLLGRLNRFDEAIATVRAVISPGVESTRARVALSELLLRKGDSADALNEAYVAAVTKPDSAHAYGHLGHVLATTGELAAAEAAYQRAAKLEPRNAHFRHEISSILSRQNRFEAAVASAKEAAELEPRNANRYVHLASLHVRGGDLTAAQDAQRHAVNLAPESGSIRVALSDLLARAGQLDHALAEAKTAVDYNPKSVHTLGHLVHVRTLRGEFELAEETLQLALELEPQNDNLLRRAAALQARRGPALAV